MPLADGLARALFVRVQRAVQASRAAGWADAVRGARAAWVEDFGGDQYSLGRAWYTHLEQGRADSYFREAARSDALVEATCPGLQDAMRELAAEVVGERVVPREGWCGPGVHVFPAGAHVARNGGDVHFDTEGLTPSYAAERAPAYTLVLMLRPPASGGGLRVWDVRYEGTDAYEDEDLARPSAVAPYEAGDLVVIDSYRLHQIQPFGGDVDRISATCHVAFTEGRWESWF